jgi:hypothetical protein
MSQQLGILVVIDIEAAVEELSLNGNTYLYDNMGPFGSNDQGTGKMVSLVHGAHFFNNEQAEEGVLNWLAMGIGSLPNALPRTWVEEKTRQGEIDSLMGINQLAKKLEGMESVPKDTEWKGIVSEIYEMAGRKGVWTDDKDNWGMQERSQLRLADGTRADKDVELSMAEVMHMTPIITGISGEAVDKNIIYDAQYGSPDPVGDGWYWCASVATGQPGTYAYTMHIKLHKLTTKNNKPSWEPIQLTLDSAIRITSVPCVNGFTGSGVGYIPVNHYPAALK